LFHLCHSQEEIVLSELKHFQQPHLLDLFQEMQQTYKISKVILFVLTLINGQQYSRDK